MPLRPMGREQMWMLPPTLDELLPLDHPARFVAEFVDALDREDWAELGVDIDGEVLGAPAYHPRALLSVWLYGFMTGDMKTLIGTITIVTIIGLFATACEPSSDKPPTPGSSPLVQPTPTVHRVEVDLGESVELPDQGIGISFDRVLEDSQCPANVVCVWC